MSDYPNLTTGDLRRMEYQCNEILEMGSEDFRKAFKVGMLRYPTELEEAVLRADHGKLLKELLLGGRDVFRGSEDALDP